MPDSANSLGDPAVYQVDHKRVLLPAIDRATSIEKTFMFSLTQVLSFANTVNFCTCHL